MENTHKLPKGGQRSPPLACKVSSDGLGDAFGSSSINRALLPRCRHAFPRGYHFSIFGVKCPYQAKSFDKVERNKSIDRTLRDEMKTRTVNYNKLQQIKVITSLDHWTNPLKLRVNLILGMSLID
jgi:hypothetical protein